MVYLHDPMGRTVGHLDFHVDARPEGSSSGDPNTARTSKACSLLQSLISKQGSYHYFWQQQTTPRQGSNQDNQA